MSRTHVLAGGLAGLALLAGCASDRPPLLEDDPRSRSVQRGVAERAVARERAREPQAEPSAVQVPPAPLTTARAPFRPPESKPGSTPAAPTPSGGSYAPRPPQVAGAPDPASVLDQDPYFANRLARTRQGTGEAAPRIGAPAAVGADADRAEAVVPSPQTPSAADGAPYALRGAAAPADPPPPPDAVSPAARPARTTPRLARRLPARDASPVVTQTPRATATDAARTIPARTPAFLGDPQAALDAVNAYRARYGYAPLRYDPVLSQAALEHARDLAARGEVTSTSVDGLGVIDRLAARGYRAVAAASLVAGGYDAFGDAMTSWRRDRVQRSRLLLPQATELGIARIEDPRSPYRYYIELIVATE